MPIYQYECRSCKHNLEELQSFDDIPLTKCPNCKKKKLFRVVTGGLGFYMSGRTVGSLADKNSSKLSEDCKQYIKQKNKTKKIDKISEKLPEGASIETPPSQNEGLQFNKKLLSATPEQKLKYIKEGKI